MKKWVFCLSLLSTVAANASVVIEAPIDHYNERHDAFFEVNKEEKRAWVSLRISKQTFGKEPENIQLRTIRSKVEGLSYDADSQAIVLEKDGALIECAKVVPRGWSVFRYDKIIPTDCELMVLKKVKTDDDGYRSRRKRVVQVHLITK